MKTRMKRTATLLLSLMLAVSAAACGGDSSSATSESSAASASSQVSSQSAGAESPAEAPADGPQENTLPIANGDVTLKIYCNMGESERQSMKDLNDHSVIQEMARQTGLVFNFMHPPVGDDGTYFNTTIASGEFPDLMYTDRFNFYPGGAEGAMEDKILMNLDELIDQYAPNFLALVEERRPVIAEQGGDVDSWIRGDGGAIIKFGTMFLPPFVDARVHNGLVIRKDWLEKKGLEAPVTIEEYTNVMQAFKDDGVEVPLALPRFSETAYTNVNPIASAFGVSINDFQLDANRKVQYSRTMPEYREYLECMYDWSGKGFIDRDSLSRTQDDTFKLFYSGRAGISFWQSAQTRRSLDVGVLEDPDFDVLGLQTPRKDRDSEIHVTRQALSVNSWAWYVSETCKNPVEAVRFVDYLHIEDTRLLTAWGLGNDEFPTFNELPDGTREWSDFMQNNPNMDVATCRAVYTAGTFQVMYDDMMERSQYNLPQNAQVWDAWATRSDNKDKMPHVMTMTVDESKEFTSIKSKMDNYADEMVYKFIFGEASLDEFDSFVAQLENLGAGRAIELQQQAYDRFISR